jgi:hypothetical protein
LRHSRKHKASAIFDAGRAFREAFPKERFGVSRASGRRAEFTRSAEGRGKLFRRCAERLKSRKVPSEENEFPRFAYFPHGLD